MNRFLQATINAINTHGSSYTYTSVGAGVYNIETGTATSTDTTYNLVMYKKHLRATQYNYPSLVGKDTAMFYLPNNSLAFVPKTNDKIIDGTSTYIVDSIYEHRALGEIALIKILAVKA